jgi:ribonucleotide reductase beta subunit family protein with ferritin-like domain
MTSEEFVDELHLVLFGYKFKRYLKEWGHKDPNESLKSLVKYINQLQDLSLAWACEGFNDGKPYLTEDEMKDKMAYLSILDENYTKLTDMLKPDERDEKEEHNGQTQV